VVDSAKVRASPTQTNSRHEIATIAEQRGLTAAEIGRLAGEAEEDAEGMMNYRHDG
jgi:hypothetical protein